VINKDIKVPRSQGGAPGYLFFQQIYTAKRDQDDKSQGGDASLVVCDKAMIHPRTMETLVDKDM
jgi:hypothetical protein